MLLYPSWIYAWGSIVYSAMKPTRQVVIKDKKFIQKFMLLYQL